MSRDKESILDIIDSARKIFAYDLSYLMMVLTSLDQ